MTAPDERATRDQVDAALARVGNEYVCTDDLHRILAAAVRALRAELVASRTPLRLDTSDFSVERRTDGRINVMVYGGHADVELDLDPGVAEDLVASLLNPEGPA